ncbi:MFS transporter [Nocardia puris]|uniref:Putative MFS family arabinose efflux permease n=1 Tax=Nocardia puris TaxID=208602 RepID=A0A366DV91_9NOCA|nr:MFS transporter [Nocardia puris]RBO94002.1 putative MFS family arabinose efflux permease [Nocardia puris]
MTVSRPPTGKQPLPDRRIIAAQGPLLLAAVLGLFPFTVYSTYLVPISDTVGAGEAAVGFLRGLGGITELFVGVAAAPLLARWPKRRVSALALITLAISGLVATTGVFAALIVFCAGVGLSTALLTPALLTQATESYDDPANAGRTATLVTATQSLAAVAAGPVIGMLGLWRGWQGTLWITAALAVVLATWFLRATPPPTPPATKQLGYLEAFDRLRARPDLLAIIAIAALRTTSFMGYLAFLAAFYHDRFDLSAQAFTLIWTVSGSAFFAGNYLAGRWCRAGEALGDRPRAVLTTGLLTALLAVLAIFHITALPAAALGTALLGFAHAIVAAQLTTLLAHRGGDLTTVAFAVNTAGMSLGVFVGAALGGVGLALGGHTGIAIALAVPVVVAVGLVGRGVRSAE